MASTMDVQLLDDRGARSGNEGRFLAYVACRINREVDRFQQEQAHTHEYIGQLAELALEILGSRDKLEAWLKAATRAREVFDTAKADGDGDS